jgi:hypothetical protein
MLKDTLKGIITAGVDAIVSSILDAVKADLENGGTVDVDVPVAAAAPKPEKVKKPRKPLSAEAIEGRRAALIKARAARAAKRPAADPATPAPAK